MVHRMFLLLGLGLTLAVMPFERANAFVSILSTDGQGADTYVRDGGFANANFGSDAFLNAKDDSPGFARKIYIRFDLSAAVGAITAASLDIQISLISGSGINPNTDHVFNVYGLRDNVAGQLWNENTLTWNNAPANVVSDGEAVSSSAQLLGTMFYSPTVMVGDIMSFSDPNLDAFLNADTDNLATLIITDATMRNTGAIFNSGDGPGFEPPTLNVVAVPEPSSLALGVLALGLMGFRRRLRSSRSGDPSPRNGDSNGRTS